MKLRVTLLTALLAVGAFAADVTGKWSAEVPGRGGQTRTQNMEFKVDGGALTGALEGPRGNTAISDGKVDGDNISFKVVREFNGNTMTQVYSGTISGDEIKFKVTTEGREGAGREFTAKRAK
ncbi:MAG TPA: hypothetical protein VGL53_03910 [Bryobacteraceae bacterium]|jgi:hypothetical protein